MTHNENPSKERRIASCKEELALLDPLFRCELYNELAFERLQRKVEDLRKLFEESHGDWNQTLHRMLFRTVGDLQNRPLFSELSLRLPYAVVVREQHSIQRIEALLFGVAGLLESCHKDAYTDALKSDFDYLKQKYNLRPFEGSEWKISRLRPANHPRLRLAQLAALISQQEYVHDRIIECRTKEDVERLFGVEASTYWSSYYNPSNAVNHSTKRIGMEKAHMIGINLVAIMQLFYGEQTGREELKRRAIDLWENLPAERNRYIREWQQGRIFPASAFESQALLQLSRLYCEEKRCAECPLGRRIERRERAEAKR